MGVGGYCFDGLLVCRDRWLRATGADIWCVWLRTNNSACHRSPMAGATERSRSTTVAEWLSFIVASTPVHGPAAQPVRQGENPTVAATDHVVADAEWRPRYPGGFRPVLVPISRLRESDRTRRGHYGLAESKASEMGIAICLSRPRQVAGGSTHRAGSAFQHILGACTTRSRFAIPLAERRIRFLHDGACMVDRRDELRGVGVRPVSVAPAQCRRGSLG